ncbi:Uncharacterized protein Fot_02103 [Forsythia ovata]|uniref:Uncharacterized protein n=1 Tax=Forsythia ovata TaxID=205694 RepID=A0ABD1X5V3_9LAMI
MSWEKSLAKKDEELGILNTKVESQDLTLVEMSAKVEALQENLANFRDSDEGKQIFEDGKQAGGTGLLELIKDELPDINFDFLYEEGETASLALPLKIDKDEIVAEPTSSTVKPASSEAVVEQTSGTLSSPTVAEPAFSETVLEPTTGTLPSQAADSTVHMVLDDNLRLLLLGLVPVINFTKSKKNPTSAPTPKVVQTKISLKAKSPPSAKSRSLLLILGGPPKMKFRIRVRRKSWNLHPR